MVRWFAERADVVLLFFDPDKPGTTGKTLSILLHSLGGMDHKLLIVLNKADQFKKIHDFARAYGSLCWNLSKVIPRKDLPRIFTMCLPVAGRGDGDQGSSGGGVDAPTIQALDQRVPSGSRIQRTAGDDSAQQHHSLLPPSTLTTTVAMTREEVSTLRAKLGRNLVHSIRTNALHGGRRVPKSTVVECGVSLDVARAIMTIDGDGVNDGGVVRMVGDTKRLVRWMVENDVGIMRALGRDAPCSRRARTSVRLCPCPP